MQTTKRNKKNLFCRLLPVFLILLYASCGSGNEEQPEAPTAEDDGISVSIRLTGQPGELTRSEADEYGTITDNYINYRDLYVMTFSLEDGRDVLTDGSQLIEVMWQPSFANTTYNGKSTVSSNGEDVYLTAQLNENEPAYKDNKNFCLVAVANVGSFNNSLSSHLSPGTPFSSIKDALKSDFKPSGNTAEWNWCPDNTKGVGIPMFGVKKVNLEGYDNKIFSAWNPYELHSADGSKDLKLLRAFAKVVVKFKDDFETPTGQEDVRFVAGGGIGNKYSGGFKVIPSLSRMEEFNTSSETGQVLKVNTDDLVSNLSSGAPPTANLQFTASPDGKYAYLYLPEYDLGTYEANNPDLTVMIAFGGIPQSFTFKFKQYPQEGETPSSDISWRYLLRNYCYRFTIDIEYGTITVVATKWGETIENEFNFG